MLTPIPPWQRIPLEFHAIQEDGCSPMDEAPYVSTSVVLLHRFPATPGQTSGFINFHIRYDKAHPSGYMICD